MDETPARAPGLLTRLLARFRDGEAAQPAIPVEAVPQPREPAEVEFGGYAEDCRLFGFMRLEAERLTDALNDRQELDLVDVLVVALDDGRAVPLKELRVGRDELLAVRASGPRGNPGRRGRMRPYPVTLQTGPYVIHGYLHGPPGADPLLHLRRRKAMVPLTEAWIAYESAGQEHRGRVGTIIVNRELIDWIRLARDEEVRLPSLPVEAAPDSRAKDLTGYIWL